MHYDRMMMAQSMCTLNGGSDSLTYDDQPLQHHAPVHDDEKDGSVRSGDVMRTRG